MLRQAVGLGCFVVFAGAGAASPVARDPPRIVPWHEIGNIGFGMTHARVEAAYGAPINGNLADYVVAVNADAPPIEVYFLDYPDKEINEVGARGIGEIGLAGVAAAITAAVHHATGVRVRELPVKIENLLA